MPIVPNYYENPQVCSDNAMPYRAYYLPASARFDDARSTGSSPTAFSF